MLLRAIGIAFLGLLLPISSGAAPAPRTEPAAAHANPVPEGVYEGTGRACGGTFQLSRKRLVWRSPFSRCSASVALIDHQFKDGVSRWVYQLGKAQKQCRYKVVTLEKPEVSATPYVWDLAAFPSVEAYRANEAEPRLNCYLIKAR